MFDFKVFLLRDLLLALASSTLALPALAVSRDVEIQQWINKHAQQLQSVEVASARYRVVGELDGDGRNDVAVLYTLKPRAARHGESRYLAAFTRQPENPRGRRREGGLKYHAHTLVSGPGAGEANRVTILNRTMVVEMLTFRPGDAACCPTGAATRWYRASARALVLVRPEPAKRAR